MVKINDNKYNGLELKRLLAADQATVKKQKMNFYHQVFYCYNR